MGNLTGVYIGEKGYIIGKDGVQDIMSFTKERDNYAKRYYKITTRREEIVVPSCDVLPVFDT